METLADLFLEVADREQERCLLHKVAGEYRAVSSHELADRVRRVAHVLLEMGVDSGDRVALMSENAPHWPTIDFAALSVGAVSVPIYPTLLPEQAAYIVRDSGAKVVFAETREQLDGLLDHRDDLPDLEHLVLIDGELSATDRESLEGVTTLGAVHEQGEGYDASALAERSKAVDPGQLASLVYTSGTTGEPKGVMLSHHNLVSNITTGVELLGFSGEQTALSFLPLSHVFERAIDYAYFWIGATIAYAESVQTVVEDMQLVRPHTFVSVPRVYEKFYNRVQEQLAQAPPLRRKLFEWALDVGREALPYRLKGEHPPGLLGLKHAVASGLVFSKIQNRLGGRFEFAFSGGAPLGQELAEFFWSVGIRIYEGYGLTETSPVISANHPGAVKLGTVGRVLPGVEVKIAEDGEILARGPNIMQGYFNKEEATREVLTDDGWFHTGDIGELDDEGFLRITDRKKELIVNAYGKNVAPAPIEGGLKASRYINQAVVLGDRRKFLSALIVPDFETLGPWAREQGLDPSDRQALMESDALRELIQGEVEAVNAKGAKYEQIRQWTLLEDEFTLEGGELTPTQKIKRRVIHEKYADQIDRLYAGSGD
jgi:long-chain acyl-CoA synthetase